MKKRFIPILFLSFFTFINPLRSENWTGFRGLEKQGLSLDAEGPVHWSHAQNILWKSSIPGEGHSSPVVSGNAIYLTTSYAGSAFLLFKRFLSYAAIVLALFLVLACLFVARHYLNNRKNKREALIQTARVALLLLLVAAVSFLIFGGDGLLKLSGNASRQHKAASIATICCLAIASLAVPLRSRLQLFLSLTALAFFAPVLMTFAEEAVFSLESFGALTTSLIMVSPIMLGALLLSLFFLAQKYQLDAGHHHARYNASILAFAGALLLGAVYFANNIAINSLKTHVHALVSIDSLTGAQNWLCEGLETQRHNVDTRNTPASPTPVTDGKFIYAYFGSAGLMCADAKGSIVWTRRLPMPEGKYGAVTSPVIKAGILIVVNDVEKNGPDGTAQSSLIYAIDCTTGNLLWKKERPGHERFASYATPLILSVKGRETVVVQGWEGIGGYDLKTGDVLWRHATGHQGQHLVSSPVSDGRNLYLTGARCIKAFDLARLGTSADPLLWAVDASGERASTAIAGEGLLFTVNEAGLALCMDARTGDIFWKKRLKGMYFSSLLCMGSRIYCSNTAGRTTVISRKAAFQGLSENSLAGEIKATPAPLADQLLIRTSDALYCITGNEARPAKPAVQSAPAQ